MLLTKQAILSAEDRKFEEVNVPEWGGVVRLATMDGKARDEYDAEMFRRIKRSPDEKVVSMGTEGLSRILLVACAVDENGDRLFTEADFEALSKKAGHVVERLFKIAAKLNGLDERSEEDALGN